MAEQKRVVFRVDGSLVIGTGHVMRCLVLARALAEAGFDCRFVSADLPGNLGSVISDCGFECSLLSAPNADLIDPNDYLTWSGLSLDADATATRAILSDWGADWLVTDHYGLDSAWQAVAGPAGVRHLVIDDLAKRPHLASILVDQNLGRRSKDYTSLVPSECTLLTGPRYAMLRPDFADLRATALAKRRNRPLKRILVSMGGVDLPNASTAILDTLLHTALLTGLEVTVVLGRAAPHLRQVQTAVEKLTIPCQVLTDVKDMHVKMAQADLAIGAVGGTAWERCVLGLPALMLTIAQNQIPAAQALSDAGAALYLGGLDDPNWRYALAEALAFVSDTSVLARFSDASAALCDGRGVSRIVQAVLAHN